MPAPSASPAALTARVTFDGKHCVYAGPTVVPSPALLTLTYAPTPAEEGSSIMIMAIRGDTTPAEIDRTEHDPTQVVGENSPDWALLDSWHAQKGSGTSTWDVHVWRVNGVVYDRYLIDCLATFPGKPVPGTYTVLRLVEPAASSTAP